MLVSGPSNERPIQISWISPAAFNVIILVAHSILTVMVLATSLERGFWRFLGQFNPPIFMGTNRKVLAIKTERRPMELYCPASPEIYIIHPPCFMGSQESLAPLKITPRRSALRFRDAEEEEEGDDDGAGGDWTG